MAGIGFELKRLFRRKGLFATMRAYGYAGIVCTGPMLLGVLLQVGILVLCGLWGVGRANQDLLVCMVTYTLLASLTLASFFSMPVTRFLADMLFAEREDEILPSFWGSNAIMLVAGTVLYGVFLLFSGATLLQGLLCLWLFNIYPSRRSSMLSNSVSISQWVTPLSRVNCSTYGWQVLSSAKWHTKPSA